MRPGCPNPGSARGRSEMCFQISWNGTGVSGRSHVTFGTMTADTPIFLLLGPTGEIWKLEIDYIDALRDMPPISDTLTC